MATVTKICHFTEAGCSQATTQKHKKLLKAPQQGTEKQPE